MNADNLYVSAYLEKLCSHFHSGKNNPTYEALQDLQNVLPHDQIAEISAVHACIDTFRKNYTNDLPVEDIMEDIKKYEELVDSPKIPEKYKAKMYDDLLSYFEKQSAFSPYYFSVLNKKIAYLPQGDDAKLSISARQALHAHRGAPKSVYLITLQRAFNKFDNKAKFPCLKELGYVTENKQRKGTVIIPAEKMPKEEARNRYEIIQKMGKMPLSSEEKISFAEEMINLATRLPFSKTDNFAIKRDMNYFLASEYSKKGDSQKAGYHSSQVERWQRNIDLAMDKGYKNGGKDFEYK